MDDSKKRTVVVPARTVHITTPGIIGVCVGLFILVLVMVIIVLLVQRQQKQKQGEFFTTLQQTVEEKFRYYSSNPSKR